eukprot:gene19801-25331_t
MTLPNQPISMKTRSPAPRAMTQGPAATLASSRMKPLARPSRAKEPMMGQFDGGGGRGHQAANFSLVLAGGGLRHRGAYGVSDELSGKPVENSVSVPDFHATVYAAMGINPAKDLVNASRPVPITDGGKPIAALFG